MKLAIISDIHANFEAFQEVLTDIAAQELDQILCLGDNIGYGPEPEAVVSLLRGREIPSTMGNHEAAIVDPGCTAWFNPSAVEALTRTKELISPETGSFIETLPVNRIYRNILCVHGCPPDDVFLYLFELDSRQLARLLSSMDQEICFVGHTHYLELVSLEGDRIARRSLEAGVQHLAASAKYIVNVGSVGQPRDGNNNAKYVIWDTETRNLDVRYVPYDIQKTADAIIRKGIPRMYADILW